MINKNILNDKRLRIVAGHYGSGKTTFVLNYAMQLANFCGDISVADLDVVNVYFRIREYEPLLSQKNIKMLGSLLHDSTSDVPAVSPDVLTALHGKEVNAVIDLGGDEAGSRAFASFKSHVDKTEADLFIVANTSREETQTADDIIFYAENIERTLGVKTTAIISNTHLMNYTTVESIVEGFHISSVAAKRKGVDVRYVLIDKSMFYKIDEIEKHIDKEKIFMLDYSVRADYLL